MNLESVCAARPASQASQLIVNRISNALQCERLVNLRRRTLALGAVLLGWCAIAQAQLIEDIELRTEGTRVIASVRFVTPVQYRRTITSRAGDLGQAFYDVLPARDMVPLVAGQRKTIEGNGLPQISVSDESVDGNESRRKLVIVFSGPTKYSVRQGRGNRSIEIVLEGMAGQFRASSGKPSTAATRAAPSAPPPLAGEPAALDAAQLTAQAESLLASAQAAYDRGEAAAALEPLNQVLNLPANTASRKAQELVGLVRLKLGDTAGARSEFELFLSLYPSGEGSDRVRGLLAGLPEAVAAPESKTAAQAVSPWSGSISTFYYGGKAKTRSQEFIDSPLSGLAEPLGASTLSDTKQSQAQATLDLNWRRRNAESDTRFVLREAYSADLNNSERNRNRLSALYVDHRSLANGTSIKAGRQSPSGGGVLYRFDGLQAGYAFAPKWKINAVAGAPVDKLLDTRRQLYGAWIDAEALTKEISGSLYFNQQTIDREIDRRAVGAELRYFSGGVSAFSQIDYDTVLKKLNITALQATWQLPDTTVFNFNYDHRAQPILSLGNILFFPDPNQTTFSTRLKDLLANDSLETLRDRVRGTTAYQKSALAGVTTPLSANWQVGADVRLSNTGEVKPVPVILPNGYPATGNIWSMGAQLIGSNLYSARDTQLFNTTFLSGPAYKGTLLSYHNFSTVGAQWQIEPSLRYYRQTDNVGLVNVRWTPGLRLTYRVRQQFSLESEAVYESSKLTSPLRTEKSNQAFYYFGGRFDF